MTIDITFDEPAFLRYFGLHQNPFPVAPDDDHFYFSSRIEQVVTEIIHGVTARKGFMVLTGEVGLGKTTIGRRIVTLLRENNIITSVVLHTSYQGAELLMEINRNFGNGINIRRMGPQLRRLNNFLLAQSHQGKNCVILIDDAQNLNFRSFELIRMISNLEAKSRKLVQIILVGQPELKSVLCSHRLRQLKSRVVIQKEVSPLNPEELKNYLAFKLNASGNNGRIVITAKAHRRIFRLTKGNLRQINVLMDRCLYVALLHDTTRICHRIITEAHRDLFPKKENHLPQHRLMPTVLTGLLATVVSGILLCHVPAHRNIREQKTEFFAIQPKGEKVPARLAAGLPSPLAPFIRKPRPAEKKPPNRSDTDPAQNADIPPAVARFLKEYSLSQFAPPLWNALKSGTTDILSQTLLKETGYCIIQLSELPDHIKKKFQTLAYTPEGENKKSFFLFWRPEFTVRGFYYGYKGKEIVQLQKRLARLGLYKAGIDRMVGRHLMKAVVSFQAMAGIPVTGYPDERTLFLLCHQ